MKTQQGKLFSLLALSATILLVSMLFYGNLYDQRKWNTFLHTSTSQANPSGPHIIGPLPNGTKVSFAEAQSMTGLITIPIPEGINIRETWITSGEIGSERQSIAIEFEGDLLLIIHPMTMPPDWNSIISSTPELMIVSVNGTNGVGTDPGATHYSGRDYPYPGSVSWWVDGRYLTLYSDTMSLQELLEIAETLH